MEQHVADFILQAESKALATLSKEGMLNVVPVSTLRVIEGKVILVNYFMEKSLANIEATGQVALVTWSKMMGYQIKGTATYMTEGVTFDTVKAWVMENIPGRVVKGILSIEPKEIFDIAPTKNTREQFEKIQSATQ
jgi:predicted pyridoxine 5'-phosphate oxidase superfamily flavin-nucleotide-binding protein